MSLEKRVIILNRVNSPDIAQAIFILKDNAENSFSALEEAERIIDEYRYNAYALKKRRRILLLPVIILAAACFVCAIFALR